MEKKALGKGLEALIPQRDRMKEVFLKEIDTAQERERIINVALSRLVPNKRQPRENFTNEKQQELIASIKEKGVIQPILVRRMGDNFEIIAGERRWRAAKFLNIKEIPVIIKEVDDKGALELALIENLQREDLNPLEEAQAYQRLIDEFNFSQDQVAQGVGKARVTVTNTLRLLKLPQPIQDAIRKDLISMAHAKVLLSVEDPKKQQQLCNVVVGEGLSVRELENLARGTGKIETALTKRRIKLSQPKDMHIKALENELQRILGTKVAISHSQKRGRVQIEYYSLQDLDRLLNLLRKIK
jgi:ParB family chromosome partitioning protein